MESKMKDAIIELGIMCLVWQILVLAWCAFYYLMRRLGRQDARILAAGRAQVAGDPAPSYEEAVGQQQPTADPEPPSYDESRMNRRRRRRHRSSRHDRLSEGNNTELQDMGADGDRNGDDKTANGGASVASTSAASISAARTAAAGNVTSSTSSSDRGIEKYKSSKGNDIYTPN